jgi:hypothetical protein
MAEATVQVAGWTALFPALFIPARLTAPLRLCDWSGGVDRAAGVPGGRPLRPRLRRVRLLQVLFRSLLPPPLPAWPFLLLPHLPPPPARPILLLPPLPAGPSISSLAPARPVVASFLLPSETLEATLAPDNPLGLGLDAHMNNVYFHPHFRFQDKFNQVRRDTPQGNATPLPRRPSLDRKHFLTHIHPANPLFPSLISRIPAWQPTLTLPFSRSHPTALPLFLG